MEKRIAHHRSEMMERARQSTYYRSQQKPHGTSILNLCSSQRNQKSEMQAESQRHNTIRKLANLYKRGYATHLYTH